MILSALIWVSMARRIMPDANKDWLDAMEAELFAISDSAMRQKFAFGCFQTALFYAARSRKGLSYIARGGGALLIVMMCFYGILHSTRIGASEELLAISYLISGLCLFYLGGAALLLTSLKGLKIYAILGFALALISAIYFRFTTQNFEGLPTDFLVAINFEVAGIMLCLFLASLYLNCLYKPELDDA